MLESTSQQQRQCEWCGKLLPPDSKPTKIYCSMSCKYKAQDARRNRRKPQLTRACKVCGKTIITSNSHILYCSKECADEARRIRIRAKPKQVKHKTCKLCGNTYVGNGSYCCPECKSLADNISHATSFYHTTEEYIYYRLKVLHDMYIPIPPKQEIMLLIKSSNEIAIDNYFRNWILQH